MNVREVSSSYIHHSITSTGWICSSLPANNDFHRTGQFQCAKGEGSLLPGPVKMRVFWRFGWNTLNINESNQPGRSVPSNAQPLEADSHSCQVAFWGGWNSGQDSSITFFLTYQEWVSLQPEDMRSLSGQAQNVAASSRWTNSPSKKNNLHQLWTWYFLCLFLPLMHSVHMLPINF